MSFEEREMKEILNYLENRKDFDKKKKKDIKKKLKGECTQRKPKTLKFYTMNLRLGD